MQHWAVIGLICCLVSNTLVVTQRETEINMLKNSINLSNKLVKISVYI